MSKKKKTYLRQHAGHQDEYQYQEKKGSLGDKIEEAFKRKGLLPEQRNGVKIPTPTKAPIQKNKPYNQPPPKTEKVTLKPSAGARYEAAENTLEYREVNRSRKISPTNKQSGTPTQISEGSPRDARDIVIGFDLGTSCTKVILQDRQLKKCYAVPFPGLGYEVNEYLLPTKLYVCRDGRCCLNEGDFEYKRIKINCIHDPQRVIFDDGVLGERLTASDLFACYVGLALIEIRKWFLREKYNDYRHTDISWQLNIGLPSRSFDDEELFKRMKQAALAAWNISLLAPHEITIKGIKDAIDRAAVQIERNRCDQNKGELHPGVVNAVPEIIAEVVGYARSPLREDGMYMLMDIGAITVDVSCFIIQKKEGDDNFPMLTSSVENLGTFMLHNERIKALKAHIEDKVKDLCAMCDEISPIPVPDEYIDFLTDSDVGIIKNGDNKFRENCLRQIGGVIKKSKRSRNPLSEAWEKGLPIFLCGGGSLIDLYNNLPEYVSGCLQKNVKFNGFVKKPLPIPKDLEGDLSPQHYHRMAVSYGLSFSALDIGTVTPERDLEDIEIGKCKLDLDSLFVSKDCV